jgi:peptidoglycan/LPS O-acetylase OafA/YrhL
VPLAQLPYHLSVPGNSLYSSLVNGFGLHRWHLFVAGIAIWMVATGRLNKLHFGLLFTGCGIAHLVHTGWITPEGQFMFDHWSTLGVVLGMVALLAAAVGPDCDGWVPVAGRRAITWLAGISYGIFLVHQTTGYVVMRRLQDLGVGPSLQTCAMVVNAVVLGWLLTRFVERPAHRYLMTVWERWVLWIGAWSGRRRASGEVSGQGSGQGDASVETATVPFGSPSDTTRPSGIARPSGPSTRS